MAIEGALGGFFESLGYIGAGFMVIGAAVFTVVHGFLAGILASKIAAVPETPTKDEYEKAELWMASLAAIPVAFGMYRSGSIPRENDTLDAIGCFLGGGLLFEAINVVEIGMSKLGVLA